MALVLTTALLALFLAFSLARLIKNGVRRRPLSQVTTVIVAALPSVLILVGMQFSSQMVGWGLLLLLPATIAWGVGWAVGYTFQGAR